MDVAIVLAMLVLAFGSIFQNAGSQTNEERRAALLSSSFFFFFSLLLPS